MATAERPETWAAVGRAPEGSREIRDWLAAGYWRPAYFYLRRAGHDGDGALALAKSAFERAAPGPRLRESLLEALRGVPADAAPAEPLIAELAQAEADLPFFGERAEDAFQQAWTAELLRRALGQFYADCHRDSRSDLYEALHRRYGWGVAPVEGQRVERQAQARFRDTLRRTVGEGTLTADLIDPELRALTGATAAGPDTCARCGAATNAAAAAQVYAGFCPRCLLQVAIEPAPKLEQVGAYEIVAKLGRDDRGELYRARQQGGRDVLLRVLEDRDDVERARRALGLRHATIIPVYDAGVVDGIAYVAAEFVDGPTLADAVPAGGLPRERATQIAQQLGAAVQHAHEAGVAHGALGASKVFLDRRGQPRIADFGFVDDSPAAREADAEALGEMLDQMLGPSAAGPRRKSGSAQEFVAALGGARTSASSSRTPAVPAVPRARAAQEAEAAESEVPGARRLVIGLVALVAFAALSIGGLMLHLKLKRPPDTTGVDGTPTPRPAETRERAFVDLGAVRARIAEGADLAGCVAAAEAFVRAWPREVEGPCVLARAEFARRNLDAAERHARRALEIDGAAPPAWRIVGFVAMEREQLGPARESLRTGAERTERWRLPRHPGDEADELLARALLLYAQGRSGEALPVLEQANRARETAEACRWIGVLLGEPQAAARWQTRALQLRQDYVPALVERAGAHIKMGRHEAAVADLDRAVELEPRNFRALLNRGVARAALGWLERAEEDLSRALEADRRHAIAWFERAQARRKLGRWQGAFEDATESVKLDGAVATVHLERGWALWKLGRREEAELAFGRAKGLDPRLRAEIERIKSEP